MLALWLIDPIRLSAWANCLYVIVFILTVIYIHHQFRESIKVRRLQVDIALNAERNRVDNPALERQLYQRFFDNNCCYKSNAAPKQLREHVSEIVRSCNRIGLLLESRYLDQYSPTIYTRAQYFVRMWFILEDHIKAARVIRRHPTHCAPMQYIVVLSLKNLLSSAAAELAIYSPNDPEKVTVYSNLDLRNKLTDLESEVRKWDRERAAARRADGLWRRFIAMR